MCPYPEPTITRLGLQKAIDSHHSHSAMLDFLAARANMVESQLRTNKVTDVRVLGAFETVPRERFTPDDLTGVAYVDEDIAIGEGRYMMEPMVLARLLQAAAIDPGDMVLDIGCGSGYSSAILAQLAATVVAVESDKLLAEQANAALAELSIDNVVLIDAPLTEGYAKQAPYNAILLNGSVAKVPDGILDQLGEGGRLVTVLRDRPHLGRAVLMQKSGGIVSSRTLFNAATPLLPGFAEPPRFVF